MIPFPFTDLGGSKLRPALVLISNERDITVAFISTQLKWQESTDVIIRPSKINGIKKDSIIRLSKIATIDRSLAIGHIGELETEYLKQVNVNLSLLFKLKNEEY